MPLSLTCRAEYDEPQSALTNRIVAARSLLKKAEVTYEFRVKISEVGDGNIRRLSHVMA